MSVNKDSANKWGYNSNIKTWSYAKNDGVQANEQWVKSKYNEWYYFDFNNGLLLIEYISVNQPDLFQLIKENPKLFVSENSELDIFNLGKLKYMVFILRF